MGRNEHDTAKRRPSVCRQKGEQRHALVCGPVFYVAISVQPVNLERLHGNDRVFPVDPCRYTGIYRGDSETLRQLSLGQGFLKGKLEVAGSGVRMDTGDGNITCIDTRLSRNGGFNRKCKLP